MSHTLQDQGWQLVSATTASIAASSVSCDLKHAEKHSFALILLRYENGKCRLQKEFNKAEVLAISVDPETILLQEVK